MDMLTGRANHIEDYLVSINRGAWFGWSDSHNKIYTNLVIHDKNATVPTEQEVTDGLAKMQSDFDALAWKRSRQAEYPSLADVTVALAEKAEGDSTMWDTITAERLAVKAKFPK